MEKYNDVEITLKNHHTMSLYLLYIWILNLYAWMSRDVICLRLFWVVSVTKHFNAILCLMFKCWFFVYICHWEVSVVRKRIQTFKKQKTKTMISHSQRISSLVIMMTTRDNRYLTTRCKCHYRSISIITAKRMTTKSQNL